MLPVLWLGCVYYAIAMELNSFTDYTFQKLQCYKVLQHFYFVRILSAIA